MKKLISLVIILGFVIMLGAAGSADLAAANFLGTLLLELLGALIILFGTSALMHYKRYLRRTVRLGKKAGIVANAKKRINVPTKELC